MLYCELFSGLQVVVVVYGLGLIVVCCDDDVGSEQVLVCVMQLQFLNIDYLGDLGYVWLCVGQFDQVCELLVKVLEFLLGNVKVMVNFVFWVVLCGDQVMVEWLLEQVSFNEEMC